jgi:hypothetical protein
MNERRVLFWALPFFVLLGAAHQISPEYLNEKEAECALI